MAALVVTAAFAVLAIIALVQWRLGIVAWCIVGAAIPWVLR